MDQPPGSFDKRTPRPPGDDAPAPKPAVDRVAIAAFVFAALGVVGFAVLPLLLLAPLGLVLAVMALFRIARARESRRGRVLAIASLVLSGSGLAFTGFLIYAVMHFEIDIDLYKTSKGFELGPVGPQAHTTFDPAAMPGHAFVCSAPTGTAVTSAATVVDGTLFVRDALGRVDAFDAHTCALRWTVPAGGPPIAGVDFPPAVADGTVYVTGWDSVLRALDAATGAPRWSTVVSLGYLGGEPVSIANGIVYVDANGLHAFDAATGNTRWSTSTSDQTSYSTPLVAAGIVYVDRGDGTVHAYDAGTGAPRWSQRPLPPDGTDALAGSSPTRATLSSSTGPFPYFTLTAGGGGVYAAGHDGVLYALDAATGTQRWAMRIGRPDEFGSAPVVVNGTVYVDTGALYAFDAATGAARWVTPTGGVDLFAFTPPVVSDGVVYVAGGDALLHAVDATTGTPRWVAGRIPPPKPDSTPLFGPPVVAIPPAVSDGTLYLGSGDERVYAYRVAGP